MKQTTMSDSHNAPSTSTMVSKSVTKISGVVKFYSVQKCYGFIKRDDTKEYVFVHSKSITGKNQRRVTRSLAKGEQVEFDVVSSDRTPEAINVTGLNGPVLGSEYGLITMQWHQYNKYKEELMRIGEQAVREQSPRARRFFHRRNHRGAVSNQKYGHPRWSANPSNDQSRKPIDDSPETKPKSQRRRYNRNRRTKRQNNGNGNGMPGEERIDNPQMTESNINTLLSELNLDNNVITANSTSSESLDFEKINTDESNIPCVGTILSSTASSRLAATFNKGNQ